MLSFLPQTHTVSSAYGLVFVQLIFLLIKALIWNYRLLYETTYKVRVTAVFVFVLKQHLFSFTICCIPLCASLSSTFLSVWEQHFQLKFVKKNQPWANMYVWVVFSENYLHVCGFLSEVFNLCVCRVETVCGCVPGLRAWLRECLKPVHSGCEVWRRDEYFLKLQAQYKHYEYCVPLCLFYTV